MKALILKDNNKGVALENVDYPILREDGVIAKVLYAGICGTDIETYRNKGNLWCKPPVVLGHEFCAEVVEVGKKVKNFKIGDKVVSELYVSTCEKCIHCRRKEYYMCKERVPLGFKANGSFAEFIYLSERCLHKINKDISPLEAVLAEPISVCITALNRNKTISKIGNLEKVLIIGPGPLGIISSKLICLMGAKKVYLVGKNSSEPIRFKIAKKVGVDEILNSERIDIVDYLKGETNNYGVDLAVETSGTISGFDMCLESIKNSGMVCEIGTFNAEDRFRLARLCEKNSCIVFSVASSSESWKMAVNIINRKTINFRPLVTSIYTLDKWKEAFEVAGDSRKSVKVLFEPN